MLKKSQKRMNYTLIMPSGRVMGFFIKHVAETYKSIYGGTIVTRGVLNDHKELALV